MKIVLSEFNRQYQTYSFGYCLYACPEQVSEIPEAYDRGFLPYSADTSLAAPVFYLARSLRVSLHDFTDTSENRRVERKMLPLSISMQVEDRNSFRLDKEIEQFCLAYAAERFAHQAMPASRLQYVLQHDLGNCFMTFRREGELIGLVYGASYGEMFHYWFSFYDTQYLDAAAPLGKWMMWKAIHWAREQGKKYVYLGTCYGPSALYKVRDFKGLSFYDGLAWSADLLDLKTRCNQDEDMIPMDYLKAHHKLSELFSKPVQW